MSELNTKLLRHDRRYMSMWVKGARVYREYGILGTDKPQTTDEAFKTINSGKANELTPVQAAQAEFKREKKRFLEEGYKEVKRYEGVSVAADSIDFDNPPKSFCVSKPVSKITEKKLKKLEGHMLYQIKENGLCHWIFKGSTGKIRIFTRRMDDHTVKYPDIAAQMERNKKIPYNTVLAVELVTYMPGMTNLERFRRMCSISRSDCTGGVCKEDQSVTHALIAETPVYGVVFHLPYWAARENGAEVTYKRVWGTICTLLKMATAGVAFGHTIALVCPKVIAVGSAAAILKWVDDNKDVYEGAVAWDLEDSIEVSFTGKPKRRNAYKLKPVRETDVVAMGFTPGNGSREGQVGALLLGQYKDGELVPYGKIGSGIKGAALEISYWNFPEAIQIEYKERFPDTGAFQHPVFIHKHPDKTPEECVFDGEETE